MTGIFLMVGLPAVTLILGALLRKRISRAALIGVLLVVFFGCAVVGYTIARITGGA